MQKGIKAGHVSVKELLLLSHGGNNSQASEIERILAEKFIEGPELRYRSAFDSMDVAIHVVDKDFKLLLFNKAFKEWNESLGLETDVIGKSIFEVFPFLSPRVRQEYERVFHTATTLVTEESNKLEGRGVITETRKIPVIKNKEVVQVITVVKDITERKHSEERLERINGCFLNFSPDPRKNIDSLVALCGQYMRASCALYNRIEGGMICSIGTWNVPADYIPQDKAFGHICYDVVMSKMRRPLVVRHLEKSSYARSDPNVGKYGLKTYIGMAVNLGDRCIGSLCAVFQEDFTPSEEDLRFMEIIAAAVGVEESRKEAQQALYDIQERQRHIIDTVTDYIFTVYIHNGQARNTVYGPTCVSVTGYTPEEFLSDAHLWIKMVPEEDRARVLRHVEGIMRGEKAPPIEHRIIKKDGSLRWVRNTTVVHFNQEGRFCCYDGLIQDITERKQGEQLLVEKEEFLSSIFSSIQDGISIVDKELNIIRVNPGMERLYTRFLPLEGKKCYAVYQSRKEPCKVCPTQRTLATGKPAYEVVPGTDEKGNNFAWFDLYSFPLFDPRSGKLAGAIEYARDITDRKKAEMASRAEREKAQNYLDIVGVIILSINANQQVELINKAGCDILGYSAEEVIGKNWFDNFIPQRQRARVKEVFNKLLSGEQVPFEYIENAILTREGKEKVISWHNRLLKDNDGRILGTLSAGEDVTLRKAWDRELLKSHARLKKMSLRDPHTGLYNHRYMQEVIEAEFYRAKRYNHPFSVMMLDVDYFKSINDVYGHQFGDLILKQLARQLKMAVRQYDIVIRFGGEEFMIISPGVDRHQALTLAQRILDAINLYNFGDKRQAIKLRLSIAVSAYPDDQINKGMDLVEIADHILSKLKEYGGNNVYSSLDIKKDKSLLRKAGKVRTDIGFLKGKIEKLTKQTNQSSLEAVFALAKTIDLKDHYTGGHVERTVRYATEIARTLGLPKDEIEAIKQAAILHDLGKIGVSERVLLKRLKLNKEEISEIQKHPQIGVDIIRPIKFLHNIIPLMLYHHERWDGKGYPSGLKGKDIPLGARIIAISDVYEALTSDRPYRKAYPKEKAVEIIRNSSGSHFDPRVVKGLLKVLS